MNKQMRKNLEAVINSVVTEDTATATTAFHDYLRAKTQFILQEASQFPPTNTNNSEGLPVWLDDEIFIITDLDANTTQQQFNKIMSRFLTPQEFEYIDYDEDNLTLQIGDGSELEHIDGSMSLQQYVKRVKKLLSGVDTSGKTRWQEGNTLVVSIGGDIMNDNNYPDQYNKMFQSKGYKEGIDYEWNIARGDDAPHAITINNPKIQSDKQLMNMINSIEGENPYS
jgi:hypothetical protein